MNWKMTALSVVLLASGVGLVLAAPGPEEACHLLSERAREAVAMKKQGLPVDKAIAQLSSQPVPASIPPAQHIFYKEKLSGATRFAYMAGMSGDGTAPYYLKQCLQGS